MKGRGATRGLVAALGIGAAVLVGGQVWAVTGLSWAGGSVGVGVLILFAAACRRLATRYRGIRFLGESRGGVDEEGLIRVSSAEREPKARVQRQGQVAPERLAGSIRALLVQPDGAGPGRKRGAR
ncbi:MAG: hypothetical protein WDA75_11310 [Candidatus Latescibacterota bacterium]